MLHILLMILKIIGIVLLVLLCIILLLLLLILFVPVRYRVIGHKDEATMDADVKVRWLLGLITFVFSYREKAKWMQLKVLGIDLLKILEKKKEKSKTTDKLQKKEDTKKAETEKTDVVKTDVQKSEESVENDSAKSEESIIVQGSEKKEKPSSLGEKIKNIISKITEFPSKVTARIQKIKLTIRNICDKISYWKEFLLDERTKAAIVLVKDHLIKLLKHIFPKKVKGQITYGFDDPCKTGQILAGVSVIYPIYAKQLSIHPDFSRAVFLGDIELKGRIYVFILAKSLLVLFFNKNIQYIIHTFRNKEES